MQYNPFLFQHGDLGPRQPQLLQDIVKAINDEFQAIQYYTRLAELAPNPQYRQSILGIRQDEIKHFYQFSRAYYKLAGKYPPLSLGVQLPSSFAVGVRESLRDERETVPFYQRLASQIMDPQIRRNILGAAEDEHRHAQIFSQMTTVRYQ